MILLLPKIITLNPILSRDILFSSQGASIESLTCTIDFSVSHDYLIKVFHFGKDIELLLEKFLKLAIIVLFCMKIIFYLDQSPKQKPMKRRKFPQEGLVPNNYG